MSEINMEREGVSRRSVLLGLGVAAGAAAAVTALPSSASAVGSLPTVARSAAVPQAIGELFAGLNYVGIDAQQFFPSGDPSNRLYETPPEQNWSAAARCTRACPYRLVRCCSKSTPDIRAVPY